MQPSHLLKLKAWLDPLDTVAQVECDGMSRIISYLLTKNGINHQVMGGLLTDNDRLFDDAVDGDDFVAVTHYWIKLDSGEYIDYRARMWMGAEAKHGIFEPENEPSRFEYRNPRDVDFSFVPEGILSIMSGVDLRKWPSFSDQQRVIESRHKKADLKDEFRR